MTAGSLASGFLAASLVATGIAVLRWQSAHTVPDIPRPPAVIAPATLESVSDSVLEDVEAAIVDNDPFRFSNTPASVRYDPAADGAGPPGAPMIPQPRPSFVLKAIVGGPPWEALVDGIPGQPPGTVVRQGSKFDRFVVRAVTRDSVVVQAPDTAWVLSFRSRP